MRHSGTHCSTMLILPPSSMYTRMQNTKRPAVHGLCPFTPSLFRMRKRSDRLEIVSTFGLRQGAPQPSFPKRLLVKLQPLRQTPAGHELVRTTSMRSCRANPRTRHAAWPGKWGLQGRRAGPLGNKRHDESGKPRTNHHETAAHRDTCCQAKFPGSRQTGTWDRPGRSPR